MKSSSFLLLFVAADLKKKKSPNGDQRLLGLQWLLDSTLLGMHWRQTQGS